MAGIAATGLGSNLDVNGLVDKLMSVEKQPLTKLDQKEAAVQVKISAYGTFKGAVGALQTSLAGLQNLTNYNAISTSVADSAVASVSAIASADLGTHTLEVQELAVAHRLKSETFASTTDPIGTGTLTIQFGSYDSGMNEFTANSARTSKSITIDSTNNSLAGIRDAINQSDAGVTASIINDGTGNRLVVTSKYTGTDSTLKISVTDSDNGHTDTSGLSQLAYDPTASAGAGQNLSQVTEAKDARFLLDGIQIIKGSNTVSDALSGVTLNLAKTNNGSATTFTIAKDTSKIKAAIDGFVTAYNELDTTVDSLTRYDSATNTAGELSGDAAVRQISGRIRDTLSHVISSNPDGYNALSQIGITLSRDGQLSVDGGKLDAALAKDPLAVQGLFATAGHTSDSLVSYVKAGSSTKPGTYALNVTQLATQGNAVGSTAAALTIDSLNDTLALNIDGKSTTLTLNQNTYASAAALAADLQSQINGNSTFSSAGIKVEVTESAGILTVTSKSYGSASKVSLSGGTGLADLFGTPTSTDGLDVAGNLGTGKTTGSGQQLTTDNGLVVQVDGGAIGDRGTVRFMRGIAVELDELLANVTGSKGTLASKVDGLQESVKDIDEKREFLNRQLEAKEQRYLNQFNTLDGLLSNMQATMSYLTQQLSSLNNNK